MNIGITPVTLEVGVSYPLNLEFYRFMQCELSRRVRESAEYSQRYAGFMIRFRFCAKSDIAELTLFGPAIYRRDKHIAFSIFVPAGRSLQEVLEMLFEGISLSLSKLKLDPTVFEADAKELIGTILSSDKMTYGLKDPDD